MKSHRSDAVVMAVALAVSTEDRLAGVAASKSRVPVCMENAVKQAQNMAAGLFASIGICRFAYPNDLGRGSQIAPTV
jgi:hypothetical protein